MHITWHGFNYFKLKSNNNTVILNPYSLDKNTTFPKVNSELIVLSDSKNFDTKKKAATGSFVIDSAGEYEVGDIFVYGRQTESGELIYLLNLEEVRVAFLGEFGHHELSNGDLELVESADILILPVGGGDLSTAKEANKLISQIEPRIVIPSCHKVGMGKLKADAVDVFIKEFGVKAETMDKLKIKQSELPQDEVKLIILDKQ